MCIMPQDRENTSIFTHCKKKWYLYDIKSKALEFVDLKSFSLDIIDVSLFEEKFTPICRS